MPEAAMGSRTQPPIAVDVLSDDDDDAAAGDEEGPPFECFVPDSLSPCRMKKAPRRRGVSPPPPPLPAEPSSVLIVIEDGPTPQKNAPLESTPFVVPETPATPSSEPVILRCSRHLLPGTDAEQRSDISEGIKKFICLESDDDESGLQCGNGSPRSEEGIELGASAGKVEANSISDARKYGDLLNEGVDRDHSIDDILHVGIGALPVVDLVEDSPLRSNSMSLHTCNSIPRNECGNYADELSPEDLGDEKLSRKKQSKEEKFRQREEKKRKRQEEKLAKEAMKVEESKLKKLQQEMKKWEKGKFALKCIVSEIDSKVVENGSIGGHLLTRFSEKGVSFRITSNPVAGSILWKMNVPDELSQLSLMGSEVQYVVLIFEAEEFCKLVSTGVLLDHVRRVQSCHPSFTVCYVINRLFSYVNKWEQNKYKNKSSADFTVRPPVEEVLCKLTTNFTRVHSRLCMDEADVADHVVGLTCSLATCQYRKKITWLSVNANGSLVSKDFIDRRLVKGNVWLRALVAIPKVQPRFAVAIWKKYRTMRSLLEIYMDPTKSVHEKEFLLQDLPVEGQLGGERRLGETCSKRVYRILMARNGAVSTDDAESGADFFSV